MTDLKQLQSLLGYHFQQPTLLDKALTHRSFLNESKDTESNERLEFLGDAVLELIITQFLFQQRPRDPEGLLTAARAAIVRTETLAQIAQNLQLGQFLKLSKGEERSGGRTNASLLANTIEAIIGALYLDGGLPAATIFINQHLQPTADQILARNEFKDAKSLLQEKVQELKLPSPTYKTTREEGPDHNKLFEIAVFVNDRELAKGQGKNKQTAQQDAAQKALEVYQDKLK